MKKLLIILALFTAAMPAMANPDVQFQTFVFQGDQQNLTRTYLSPGLNPLLKTSCTNCLVWELEFQDLPTSVWSATIDVPGFRYTSEGDTTKDCGLAHCIVGIGNELVSRDPLEYEDWNLPFTYVPTQGALSVTLDGTTDVYAFRYQVVPEPSSLILLGSGLVGLGTALRRKIT